MKKNKNKNKIKLFIITFLFIGIISLYSIPNIKAETVTNVPANANLQEYIDNAKSGDVLNLAGAAYSKPDVITINKNITIKGSSRNSVVRSKIVIKDVPEEEGKSVTLKDMYVYGVMLEEGEFSIIDVKSKVNLNIDNVICSYAARPSAEDATVDRDVIILNLDKNSSESNLNINKSQLVGSFDGLNILSSTNKVTINDSKISGRLGIDIGGEVGGRDNTINMNNVEISGRSKLVYSESAIEINGQKNLKLTIDGEKSSSIIGAASRAPAHIFSFDEFSTLDAENLSSNLISENTSIIVKGNTTIIDNDTTEDSKIINFSDNNTPANKNYLKFEDGVKIIDGTVTDNEVPVALAKKYNTSEKYNVVGIYDKDGNLTVKLYDKSIEIPNESVKADLETAISGVKPTDFVGWFKDANYSEPFNIESDAITSNMELHPKIKKTVDITIKTATEEKSYNVDYGTAYEDFYNANKEEIDELVKVEGKNFKKFAEAESYTQFFNDITLTPLYTITLTVKDTPFEIDENTKWSDLDIKILNALNALKNSRFSRYVDEKNNTVDEKTAVFSKSITINAKYKVALSVKDTQILIEEGTKYQDIKESDINKLKTAATVADKTLKGFKDVTKETVFNVDTTLTPLYTITVTIKDKSFEVDENTKLSELQNDVKTALENLKTDRFSRYVDENDNTINEDYTFTKKVTISAKYNVSLKVNDEEIFVEEGTKYQDINESEKTKLKQAATVTGKNLKGFKDITDETVFNEDTTLTPIYTITVTVKEESFEVDENTKWNDLSTEVTTALNNLKNDRFLRFVDENGNTLGSDYTFTTKVVISAKYSVLLKANNTEIYVEEGTKYQDIKESDKTKLEKAVEVDGKKLKGFKDIIDATIFTEDTILIPQYSIILTVDASAYEIDENTKLNELPSEVKNAIEALKTSKDKTFSRFVDSDGNTITEESIFTKSTTIIPKFMITVTIGDEEFTIEEGSSLNTLAEPDKARLEALKVNSDKTFKNFVNSKTKQVVDENTILDDDVTLEIVYETPSSEIIPDDKDNDNDHNINNREEDSNDEVSDVPNTYDNIILYIVISIITLISIIFIGIKLRKKQNA